MKILHVIPSLDARDGGPSIALPLMARGLAMEGIAVDVATTMRHEDARNQGITFGEPQAREGYTVRFFQRQTNFYKASLPLYRWLRTHVAEYALVHNHAVFSFAPLAAARIARSRGIPYLMRPLGLLNRWGMTQRRPRLKALSFRWLDRRALERAAAIHYTSEQEAADAAVLNLNAKSVIVPLGIDVAPFQQPVTSQTFFARFPQASGKRCVLFLSRLDPKKGLEVLMDAFSAVNRTSHNAMLVAAGGGDPSYESKLRHRASKLGIDGDLIWTGHLEETDKLSALAAAEIFVLPSHSENFGIALVEAMAAGKACIASEGVAVAGEMQQAHAGLVVPSNDAPALTVGLTQLLADQDLRARLGANASRLAKERFSLTAMGASLARVYRDILSAPKTS